MAKEKATTKVKRPTPLKRDEQNEKRRLSNKIYKSQVRTAIRAFEDTLQAEDKSGSQEKLSHVYSLLDKCVKKGIFKLNKASRTKARLAARAVAQA